MVKKAFFDNNGIKKGEWSEEEDSKLSAFITRNGLMNWRLLPKCAGLTRCGKSCRLRWVNYLKPGVIRGNFSEEEVDRIIQLRQQLGNKWSIIAKEFPGRTDNDIKNHWHGHIKKLIYAKSPKLSTQSFSIQRSNGDYANTLDHDASSVKNPEILGSPNTDNSMPNEKAYDHAASGDSDQSFWNDLFQGDIQSEINSLPSPVLPAAADGDIFKSQFHNTQVLSPIYSLSTALEWITDDDIVSPNSVLPQESTYFQGNKSDSTHLPAEVEGSFYDQFFEVCHFRA